MNNNKIAFCKKHKFNIYVSSCITRKQHNAISCNKCQGVEKPILDCLTREYSNNELSNIFQEAKKESRHCDRPKCKRKHYQNGLCVDHYNEWYLQKGKCDHFNRIMSRSACYQKRKLIEKCIGIEANKYCINCQGNGWNEI